MFTGFVAIFIFPTVKDGILTRQSIKVNYSCRREKTGKPEISFDYDKNMEYVKIK